MGFGERVGRVKEENEKKNEKEAKGNGNESA